MSTFYEMLPEFCTEVSDVLEAKGYEEIAAQVSLAEIERCSYDPEADAGYIHIKSKMSSLVSSLHKVAAPVRGTIVLDEPHCFNVDVDYEGNLFGIELFDRRDVIERLRSTDG